MNEMLDPTSPPSFPASPGIIGSVSPNPTDITSLEPNPERISQNLAEAFENGRLRADHRGGTLRELLLCNFHSEILRLKPFIYPSN